jgi:hypothetical protein
MTRSRSVMPQEIIGCNIECVDVTVPSTADSSSPPSTCFCPQLTQANSYNESLHDRGSDDLVERMPGLQRATRTFPEFPARA